MHAEEISRNDIVNMYRAMSKRSLVRLTKIIIITSWEVIRKHLWFVIFKNYSSKLRKIDFKHLINVWTNVSRSVVTLILKAISVFIITWFLQRLNWNDMKNKSIQMNVAGRQVRLRQRPQVSRHSWGAGWGRSGKRASKVHLWIPSSACVALQKVLSSNNEQEILACC